MATNEETNVTPDAAPEAPTPSHDAALNKSEHDDEVKASLNKNDINKNIVELQEESGRGEAAPEGSSESSENQAREQGPYGVSEEGYDNSNEPVV